MNPLATAETTRTIYVNGLRKPNRPELRRRAFFVTSLPFSLEDSRHTVPKINQWTFVCSSK